MTKKHPERFRTVAASKSLFFNAHIRKTLFHAETNAKGSWEPNPIGNAMENTIEDLLGSRQKAVVQYFQDYFANGGQANHPIIGDLSILVDSVRMHHRNTGEHARRGLNLAAEVIAYHLANPKQSLGLK